MFRSEYRSNANPTTTVSRGGEDGELNKRWLDSTGGADASAARVYWACRPPYCTYQSVSSRHERSTTNTIYNMYRSKATTSQSPIASHGWRRAKSRLGPGLHVSLDAARFRMQNAAFAVNGVCLKAQLCQSLAFALLRTEVN